MKPFRIKSFPNLRCDFVLLVILLLLGTIAPNSFAAGFDEKVEQAQYKLDLLGYTVGAVDGLWGKKTASAIRKYQKDIGLPETGQLDQPTLEKLKIVPMKAKIVSGVRKNFITYEQLGWTPPESGVQAYERYKNSSELLQFGGRSYSERLIDPRQGMLYLIKEGDTLPDREDDCVIGHVLAESVFGHDEVGDSLRFTALDTKGFCTLGFGLALPIGSRFEISDVKLLDKKFNGTVKLQPDGIEHTPSNYYAERGDAKAQNTLGLKYQRGQGVIQDYKTAFKWYKKAAEQGYAQAQINLGVLYAEGKGVAQNRHRAYMWLELSGSGKSKLNLIGKEMTYKDVVHAKQLAKKCKSKNYKDC
jgi:hypothetical protein